MQAADDDVGALVRVGTTFGSVEITVCPWESGATTMPGPLVTSLKLIKARSSMPETFQTPFVADQEKMAMESGGVAVIPVCAMQPVQVTPRLVPTVSVP